ncbi:MAG: TonB-dependent receptor [Acidobacteriota bacterium]|nr:TonB-dependent receptor [Acidobacteriota bacterium]
MKREFGQNWKSLFITVVAAAFVAATALIPRPAAAQDITAGLIGTVTDPSGASIPGAKVTAQDTARGTVWTTQTNSAGIYNLPRLPASTYNVTVEAKGFQTAVRPNILLEVDQKARVDVKLSLGTISQKIEVTGAPPLLQTETTEVGTVINAQTNVALPLATRNYVQLTMLAPGTTNPNPQTMTNGQGSNGGGRPYVNGNREQADNFVLDGNDNNQVSDNLVGYQPSVDAIQEFNEITANAPPEFGNFMGAIVNATIKSGTDHFHGNAFEFVRNDIFNAAQWSDNLSASPKAKVRWNMFGGTFGGPIKKDKLFFFVDYQGERFDNPNSVGTLSVFTAAERLGDFSQQLGVNNVQIYNPCANTNGPCQPLPASATARQPFVGNKIPIAMLDPVAAKLFSSSLYPAPVNGNLASNQYNASRGEILGDQGDVKIDWNASMKDHIYGRYSQSRSSNPGFNSFPLFYNSFSENPIHSGVIDWTRSISSTIVNDARVGVNRVLLDNGAASKAGLGNVAAQLGIAGVKPFGGVGLPSLSFGNTISGIGSSNVTQLFHDTVMQYADALILTKDRHVIHAGFQAWRQQINTYYSGNNGAVGLINYSGQFTAGPGISAIASSTAGLGGADFFLGLPTNLGEGVQNGVWGQRSTIFAAYVGDNWRLTDNLNVNYGVRYENHTPWVEVHNNQANFGLQNGIEYFAGKPCPYSNCRALYNSYNLGLDFQPRLGFAWTPHGGKTVFRGAYTISSYLEGTGTNLRLPLNPPFSDELNGNYAGAVFPSSLTAQGFTTLSAPGNPLSGAILRVWDPNVMPAAVQQWNFSAEHQFADQTTLNVGYVGEHSTHLMVPMPYLQREAIGANGCTAQNATIAFGNTPTCPSAYLRNPALSVANQASGTASNGDHLYDALQATIRKRFSNGLQYQVAYTYSKCMTNSSGYYGSWGGQVIPTSPYWQNVYDMRAEWAPCYYDATHILSSYVVYQLPFGKKMKFGNSWNPVVNAVLGNWQMSGIYSWHTGYPNTISAGDESGTNSRGSRASCIGPDITLNTGNVSAANGGGIQWFDPASYTTPSAGQFGNCANATTRGPGLSELDMSFQKNFPIGESKAFEFRAEFINFTNTPILGAPSTGIGSSLGYVQGSQGARNVQFALKFTF